MYPRDLREGSFYCEVYLVAYHFTVWSTYSGPGSVEVSRSGFLTSRAIGEELERWLGDEE